MKNISKVWIDCDPGIDDALTLIAAYLEDRFEVVGISSVSGNVSSEKGKNNICEICEILDWEVPIFKGNDKKISQEIYIENKFTKNSLGYHVNNNTFENYGTMLSEELYLAAKESEKLDIIAIGPTTNIAKAVVDYPDIVNYLDNIFIMGGSLNGGNITSNAEFNVYSDPKALSLLLENDLNIFLFSLDLTTKFSFTKDYLQGLNKNNTSYKSLVDDMLEFLIDENSYYDDEIYLHDIFALYGYIYKDGIIYEQINIKVQEDGEYRGAIFADESGSSVYYAVKLNEENFKTYLEDTFR